MTHTGSHSTVPSVYSDTPSLLGIVVFGAFLALVISVVI